MKSTIYKIYQKGVDLLGFGPLCITYRWIRKATLKKLRFPVQRVSVFEASRETAFLFVW